MSCSSASASIPFASASFARGLSSDVNPSSSPGSKSFSRKRSPFVTRNSFARPRASLITCFIFMGGRSSSWCSRWSSRRSSRREDRASARRDEPLGDQLRLPRVVDRLGEDTRELLRSVESHRILGSDEVEPPLRLPMEGARRLERALARAPLPGGDDRVEHLRHRLRRALQEFVVAVLGRGHAPL